MEISPAITILMPAYNAEKYIHRAIASIINQTFTNWELLIGDDNSNDTTLDIVKQISTSEPRIKFYSHSRNLGYLLNCNYLWAKAAGSYVTFMDADDWSDKKRLQIQYLFLTQNIDIDICCTDYYRVDENDNIIDKVVFNDRKPLDELFNEFLFKNDPFPIFPNSMFFKKEVSAKIGYYHEFFSRKCGEDWDWILRANPYFKITNIPEPLYYYRENSLGVSQTITVDKLINRDLISKIHQILKVENKNLLEPVLESELLKLEADMKKPYLMDYSLLAYAQAGSNIYHRDFKLALKNILKAIYHKPLRFKYYKTLKFILSRILIKKMREN